MKKKKSLKYNFDMIYVKACQKNPKEDNWRWGDTQIPISDDEYCEISSKISKVWMFKREKS